MDSRDKELLSYAGDIEDSDELRNLNCWEYLRILAVVVPDRELPIDSKYDFLRELSNYFSDHPAYDSQTPYGDMYTSFLSRLEDVLERDNEFNPLGLLDEFIIHVFVNPNSSLLRSELAIRKVLEKPDLSHTQHGEKAIGRRLTGIFHKQKNETTPEKAGSLMGRLSSAATPNFKPMLTTSMVSVRTYTYCQLGRNELRMGTMAQRHKGDPRVSPLFLAWLDILKFRRRRNDPQIVHIYFNNLPRDREGMEGEREVALTNVLEQLNTMEDTPIAVVTLPADQGLMSRKSYRNHQCVKSRDEYFELFSNVALGTDKSEKIHDFYISENIDKLLFDKPKMKAHLIKELLHLSFEKLGFSRNVPMSEAQAQAVYFHFIKYELPNYMIETLKPASFNFSCKDGIDRGGVSSAYYNLMKSIELNNPMTQEEFNQALHAAPALVKGRGINDHIRLIWNAIDTCIESHAENKMHFPDWLIAWRTKHAPPHTIQWYINKIDSYIDMISRKSAQMLGGKKFEELAPEVRKHIQDVSEFGIKLKAILRNRDLDIQLDMRVLNHSPELKSLCEEITKELKIDLQTYAEEKQERSHERQKKY